VLLEYTAIQNLYHELAHAMHMTKGSWRYFASEKQAIEEENIFRRDLALMQNTPVMERWRQTASSSATLTVSSSCRNGSDHP
jgi:hypothetical protein